ncbi:MAG: UDP-N-acetyl-D-mannosamine dehydrogenase, partial [Erysipelotrichia bacterium]|nr:UDP-N-acetyl-D-mannosamine dehydrogenase [Erysipelotrichia bacterium]
AFVIKRVLQAAERFKNPVIGVLGLSYKQDIDDLRESPAVEIAHELKKSGVGKIMVCEPFCRQHREFELSELDAVIKEADIIVLLVAHRQFKNIDPELLKPKIVIDTCGIW